MPLPVMAPVLVGCAAASGVTSLVKHRARVRRAPMWNRLADQFGVSHPPKGVEFLAFKTLDLDVQILRKSRWVAGPVRIEVFVPMDGAGVHIKAKPPKGTKWQHPELDLELFSQMHVRGLAGTEAFLTPARQRTLMAMARDHPGFILEPYMAGDRLGVFKYSVPGDLISEERVERVGRTAVKLATHARAFVDGG